MPDLSLDPLDGSPPILLTDENGYTVMAMTGLEIPPRSLNVTAMPDRDGARFDSLRVAPREIGLAIGLFADERSVFLRRRHRLHKLLGRRVPVRITHIEDDGNRRWIDGYYVGGVEGSRTRGEQSLDWARYMPMFRCPDPWWRGEQQTFAFSIATPADFFPFFPLTLASSLLGGRRNFYNDGDEPTYPTWTITGPGADVVLTNHTTGKVIEVVGDILDGDQVIIDTRPGYQTVKAGDGTNLFAGLSSNPPMWPLAPGDNDVEVALTGATSGAAVSASWAPLYEAV